MEARERRLTSIASISFQRPEQFPIMPKAERGGTEAKSKMISLETLQDALPDFGKEQEV